MIIKRNVEVEVELTRQEVFEAVTHVDVLTRLQIFDWIVRNTSTEEMNAAMNLLGYKPDAVKQLRRLQNDDK